VKLVFVVGSFVLRIVSCRECRVIRREVSEEREERTVTTTRLSQKSLRPSARNVIRSNNKTN